eukprot:TRINITY_DN32096_c0_g1_i1.p2 TRINITY_DN32096_c0_g1~~TRINITY_DN32096_c0_g1_i1.p2  ORF type:complete len:112 (-),score=27.20 TRINITY_DN32096_c0_g1_i1:61-396(-)
MRVCFLCCCFFFFFKQKTAYEMLRSLVGSEMCIRDSVLALLYHAGWLPCGISRFEHARSAHHPSPVQHRVGLLTSSPDSLIRPNNGLISALVADPGLLVVDGVSGLALFHI